MKKTVKLTEATHKLLLEWKVKLGKRSIDATIREILKDKEG